MKRHTEAASYTVYGYAWPLPSSLIGFKGEYADLELKHYQLGAGHRLYSPILMRFLAADIKSPFEQGGINAYAYCGGDPVNRIDPTGQSWLSPVKGLGNLLGLRRRQAPARPTLAQPQTGRRSGPNAGQAVTTSSSNEPAPPSYRETFKRFPQERRGQIRITQERMEDVEIRLDIAERMNQREKFQYAAELHDLERTRDRLWSRPIPVPLPTYDELFPTPQPGSPTTASLQTRRVRFAT